MLTTNLYLRFHLVVEQNFKVLLVSRLRVDIIKKFAATAILPSPFLSSHIQMSFTSSKECAQNKCTAKQNFNLSVCPIISWHVLHELE